MILRLLKHWLQDIFACLDVAFHPQVTIESLRKIGTHFENVKKLFKSFNAGSGHLVATPDDNPRLQTRLGALGDVSTTVGGSNMPSSTEIQMHFEKIEINLAPLNEFTNSAACLRSIITFLPIATSLGWTLCQTLVGSTFTSIDFWQSIFFGILGSFPFSIAIGAFLRFKTRKIWSLLHNA